MLRKALYLLQALNRLSWDADRIRRYQNIQLQKMVMHAYSQCSLYRKKFEEHGLNPRSVKTVDDLKRIPFTLRNDIALDSFRTEAVDDAIKQASLAIRRDAAVKSYTAEMVAANYRKRHYTWKNTSGSSGLFVSIAVDKKAEDFYDAIYARSLLHAGYRPWQRILYFTWVSNIKKKIYETLGFFRKEHIHISETANNQHKILEDSKFDWIIGFPSAFRFLDKASMQKKRIQAKGIVCHGEILSEFQRNHIQELFGCAVFDAYAASECNRIASECAERNGLHVAMDNVIIEVIDSGGNYCRPGEDGEIVLTTLQNYTMPLIRYKIGDFATMGDAHCKCGCRFVKLDKIQGRCNDFFYLPSGRIINPLELITVIEYCGAYDVYNYRLVQQTHSTATLYAVDYPAFDRSIVDELKSKLTKYMNNEICVSAQIVKDLPANLIGKRRVIISKVKDRSIND
ncbi:MAG: phenylacetate--CoA ligase family protein [Candidatus Omnitrophica bacterium]|nr:phenylacetate--CoA ligase family protein [Candidatus Omnitrophota bacterium]